jgi:hypothetical protein
MKIEKIPKRVFGSNEEFVLLHLLYDNGDDRFRREELKVLFEVFKTSQEAERRLTVEDFEYKIAEELLNKSSVSVRSFDNLVFNLYLPKLYFPKLNKETEFVFRNYNNFRIWFVKLDDDHFITNYFYVKHEYFNDIYYYVEYFEYRNKLYRIFHILNYDLIDDYPKTAKSDLTEIVRKDKLAIYLKHLEKRHGKPIYFECFDEEDRIELLDYLYPDVGGEKLLSFMKANSRNEEVLFDVAEYLDLKYFIRFLNLSQKFYKQLSKEV